MFDPGSFLYTFSYAVVPLIFAITVHEVAHGWVAKQRGDPTASRAGRLTLNPIRHIDPFGTVLVPIGLLVVSSVMRLASPLFFGWAKPVPVAVENLARPRLDMALVALAGPGVNIAMATGWAVFATLQAVAVSLVDQGSQWLYNMAVFGMRINLLLAMFNMLPIPPLDGGRVLVAVLPDPLAKAISRIEPFGILILVALIVLEYMQVVHFLSAFISSPVNYFLGLFTYLIRLGTF